MFTCERVNRIPGLKAIVPAGTMYVMVQIDTAAFRDLKDDMVFSEKLVQEQSVFVLPGQVRAKWDRMYDHSRCVTK